jgi:expansin
VVVSSEFLVSVIYGIFRNLQYESYKANPLPISFSLQVLNCNYPIIALDVSTDNTQSWQPTVRRDYNFFEKDKSGGFDKDIVTIRITCSNGRSVIIPNVSMASEAKTVAPVNC